MRLVWLWWLVRHSNNFGYSHGLLRAGIGTFAVLITAVVAGLALRRRRHRLASVTTGAVVFGGGVAWLACH
ncbi:hypothetical protein I5Q34_13060 [Streptomyces sp. AV19]|uniref:hypothetical protein n=1 Tax=Streptomyces sp. AV19 TaxID=2793068 RepID=UPI0018FE1980|nr:hypothetical protein [Streptomyces sp. AV19]MBH1935192.1 hypothetical protein [Streptomyces sp. AV19]MDG4532021.1 hypothetical protein [Streptomyces sp. AV19]